MMNPIRPVGAVSSGNATLIIDEYRHQQEQAHGMAPVVWQLVFLYTVFWCAWFVYERAQELTQEQWSWRPYYEVVVLSLLVALAVIGVAWLINDRAFHSSPTQQLGILWTLYFVCGWFGVQRIRQRRR